MLKVFLVEDEVVIREGIKNNIHWKEEGFDFVGEASDGELAYPMIQKVKADILITDIKMPFMDGLELSKLVKNEMPWIKIIILSGYDEFEYAKEAISIGITDYLLKPVSGCQLLEAVKKVAKVIEKEREKEEFIKLYQKEMIENEKFEKKQFFEELISGRLGVSKILEKAKKLKMNLAGQAYNIILFKVFPQKFSAGDYDEHQRQLANRFETLFMGNEHTIIFNRASSGWAILVKTNNENEMDVILNGTIKDLEKESSACSLDYFGGIGKTVHRLGELNLCFDHANGAFAYRYMLPKNQIIHNEVVLQQTNQNKEIDLSLKSINIGQLDRSIVENFLHVGTKDSVKHFLENYISNLGIKNVTSLFFRQYITMDMYICCIALIESLGYQSEDIVSKCGDIHVINSALGTLDKTKEYLEKILMVTIQLRDEVAMKKYKRLMDEAKAFIQENYDKDDISLNKVADAVCISPSHFSTIFSHEEGRTFVEYLTDIRMKRAKELLKCSSMKSSEIAFAIGYKDPHYFSYIFKKTQNCTPKEFRIRGV